MTKIHSLTRSGSRYSSGLINHEALLLWYGVCLNADSPIMLRMFFLLASSLFSAGDTTFIIYLIQTFPLKLSAVVIRQETGHPGSSEEGSSGQEEATSGRLTRKRPRGRPHQHFIRFTFCFVTLLFFSLLLLSSIRRRRFPFSRVHFNAHPHTYIYELIGGWVCFPLRGEGWDG